ncbi:2-(1,2-epoxy-1,2-dihydrophenyl)acetyl-CoA isomerase [Bacillus ectoiniformans]|uniref:enoyl-CoA hydratase/isomerase family protein n=1 Tax=Bacillus ectoiniformans TaxID=1494429 RepID=UPI001957D5C9|nr:enoyl-CoA hydratase [Bacillus ectoiniformans]MBM7647696.1 2-(1,2-epoxy-1,2-dihydrophenyl)acetyl-CoA isomerase [Bacillus ectoiniformans]
MGDLLIERKDGLLILTLNRPESLNAFSADMITGLTDQIKRAKTDHEVKVIVLKGAGRAFTAGGDVKSMGTASANDVYEHIGELNQCIVAIQESEKPVVACVHGFAAGAGFNLALACDFIVAAEDSQFVLSFAQVGLISDGGGLYFLPKLLGLQKTKELLFLAKPLTAKEAEEYGIVNIICPLNELEIEVQAFAERLAKGPLKAYGKMKKILHDSYLLSLDQVLERERLTQMLMVESADHSEGVAAFKEKRQPVFSGK